MNGAPSVFVSVLVASLLLGSVPPLGLGGTADAETATIVVEEALDDTPKTETMSVVVRATGNQSISVSPTSESRDGGAVEFRFNGWEDLDGGQSGTDSSWTPQQGHRYRITYEATVRDAATEDRHSVSIRIDGPVDDGGKSLDLTVDVREPEFGRFDAQQVSAVFEERDSKTVKKTFVIRNAGDGVMKPTEVSTTGVPTGFSVSADELPGRIAAEETGEGELEINIDPSVDAGEYRFTVEVIDSLENSRSFEVEVDVSKPPRSSIQGGSISLGDVLVGEDKSISVEVIETIGFTGLDGVSAKVVNQEPDGDIRFDGLRQVSTEPGGSESVSVVASVNSDARQHSDLDWEVRLTPDNSEGLSSTIQVTGRVIYPPYYGELSAERTAIRFDEPRSEVSSFTETVAVTIQNSGDLEMDVERVSASASDPDVSASVINEPSTIPGLDQRTAQVEIEADPDASEGPRDFVVTVESAKAGQEQISQAVEIQQEPSLEVSSSTVDFGEIIITRSAKESTRISEALGYEAIENLEVEKVSGPDQWITVTERPSGRLSAGGEAPMVVSLRFDTNAELFQQYTWKYRISGDGVESQVVTIQARAKPFSFERIRQPLTEHEQQGDWQQATAGPTVEILDRIERRLENGENVTDGDISTALASARSTSLFIQSVEQARQTIETDGHEAAQSEVVRAAAAYNSMSTQASSFGSDELQASADESLTTAEEQLSILLSEQTEYYQSELSDGDTSLRESAQIKQRLARLALLQGDRSRAEELRAESREAFEEYVSRVESGSERRQAARDLQQSMVDSTMIVVLDQWLVLNPAAWDTFESQSERTLARYDAAAETFENAGAVQERKATLEAKSDVEARLEFARYSLYAATGFYLLVFVGVIGHLTRGVYGYIRDSRARASGDFLIQ